MTPPSFASIELQTLSMRFRSFAEECRGSSPLYEQLVLGIAADDDMLKLAAHCQTGQPPANLFLAAVHFLLLRDVQHPLASFYPDLSAPPQPAEASYPAFQGFCWTHRAAIMALITSRLVQTNEVRRCSYLFPAFSLIASLANHQPLAVVEIGTSAGLNLMWDAYGYHYHNGLTTIKAGNRQSLIQLECTLRGAGRPQFPDAFPSVASKTGIDLNIVDLRDDEAYLWLRALIWPEHAERVRLLQNARPIVNQASLELISGDALDQLPRVVDGIPAEVPLVIFHTHTVNQFSQPAYERLSAFIAELGSQRQVFRLANDLGGGSPDYFALKLITFQAGQQTEQLLAYVDGHGRWLEWLAA